MLSTRLASFIRRVMSGSSTRHARWFLSTCTHSKSKPDLGDIFMTGDPKNLRNATATQTVLPPSDPVTADLLNSMNFASSMTHNNFITFVSHVSHDISIKDDQWTIKLTLNLYGGSDLGVFLRLALWVLRVMERVLRVLAVSFDLTST